MPSKPKPEAATTPSSAAEESKPTPENEPQPERTDVRTAGAAAPPTTSSLQDYTPEELEKHLEEAELQILVDKYAFKCKNDATRQATKLDNERRVFRQQSVTLSLLEWLPTDIQDSILELGSTEEHDYLITSGRVPSSKQAGSDEDLYNKLWTLKETLLKLDFPANRVEDALKHVLQYFAGNSANAGRDVVWNLDEAIEWLATHSDKNELPSYTQTNTSQLKGTDSVTSWMTGTPFHGLDFSNGT